ncbi:hypothetical protein MLD38_006536 [Melastoma candidum]|uniref:Uncharacterized protein n=1 Tax=Melastoma candidum TaxID=119954 RepID=A0ACB9RN64_9MYRT|nr:hypothetical protein MLD38_006536 [Melastoma candidum]
MGRSPCCAKEGLNKGAWTAQEDAILTAYINSHGEGQWRNLPKRAGLMRCGKSCRLRWLNYLRPDIVRGNISPDEEELIIRLHKLLGNRWSLIAGRLPGRTDNEIKNYWNTNLGKRTRPNSQHQQHRNGESRSRRKSSDKKVPQPNFAKAVRTKASKCSSRIIVSPHQRLPEKDDRTSGPSTDSTAMPSAALSPAVDHGMDKVVGGIHSDGVTGTHSDLTLDFNIGDNCWSELLGSDFWETTTMDGLDLLADGSIYPSW